MVEPGQLKTPGVLITRYGEAPPPSPTHRTLQVPRRLRDAFMRLARRIEHPSFELDSDEAAAIVSTVDEARSAGAAVDRLACAPVNVLRRQLADANNEKDVDVTQLVRPVYRVPTCRRACPGRYEGRANWRGTTQAITTRKGAA